MGQSLTRAAQWTSAKDGSGGKLEFTPQNEAILNEIIKFADGFSSRHPDESRLVFKSALVWTTTLDSSSFSSGGFRQQGEDFVSEAVDDRTQAPLLKYEKEIGKNRLHVHSMEMVDKVLSIAGDKKLIETRQCLEENRDPTASMLGDRFATVEGEDNSLLRFIEEMTKDTMSAGDTEDEDARRDMEDKKRTLKLVLAIQQLDNRLLNLSIVAVSKETRLRPEAVATEVQVLKRFSGKDEDKNVLESIEFTDNYVYDNGCRAAPWRQMYGEIAYLLVKPHDADEFYVTAATNGYFINKGLNEKNELDYERDGEIYRDLVTLIKTRSAHFAELIDRQEFVLDDKDRDELEYQEVDGDELDEKLAGREQQRQEEANRQREKKKKKKEEKRRYEPSLKWKSLGLDEGKEEEKQKEEDKKSKESPSRSKARQRQLVRKRKDLDEQSTEPFSESSSEDESEEETLDRRQEAHADLPSEYWQIQKLVKYLKGGNQTATIIALCAMRDFNLSQETCQLAIRDVGGLEVLINLLQTEEPKCKIGALQILKEISKNPQIRRAIADLGGLPTMVKILRDPNKELKCLAAETIANVAKFRRARRTVRQHGGIRRLVGLLQCPPVTTTMTPEIEKDIEVARCGALALWSLSKSTKNKHAMRTAGVIPLLARLLKSPHENMLIPVVGSLQECASEKSYRLAIRTEGMVEDLVRNLARENPNEELQMHCASAIFKCAEEKATRDLVRRYEGLDPLVSLLSKADNKELLAAATGAIWKCSISPENVERFKELKAIDMLVSLLNDQPEEVLVNVVGALSELAKDQANRHQIRKAGGISPLVNLLTGTNQSLLVNTTRAVGQCAQEPDNMSIIDRLDGVRLLWSLLKNQNPEVQASAAWAICPCIENAKEAGEMVRSFVGGLELIVSLLKSDDIEVLASVCAAIANIAKDEENLAVITDHGVVPMLAKLTDTNDDKLRQHLAEAIARCCTWGANRVKFGDEGAVSPLVNYLRSKDEKVHRSTAHALYQLSRDPNNCICMHEAGVVKLLLGMVGSADPVLQEAAAGCIGNIRRLALANERADRA